MKPFVFLYTLLAAWLLGCGSGQQDAADAQPEAQTTLALTPAEMRTHGVQTGPLRLRNLGHTLVVNGKVHVPADNLNTISTPIAGTVKQLLVHEGQPVGAGAVLLLVQSMEFIQLQEDYLTAKQQLHYAQQEQQRQQTLLEGNATAAKLLQKANADFEGMRVRYHALRTRLQVLGIDPDALQPEKLLPYLPIRAAQSGKVQRLKATPGAFVRPEDPLLSLVNASQLHTDLQIFGQEVPKVRVGQAVKVFALGSQTVAWQGTLHSLDAAFDPQQQYLSGHVLIPQNHTALVSGMLVRCELTLDTAHSSPALPDAAFVTDEDKDYVFAADSADGKLHFHRLAVQKGASAAGYTAIADTTALSGYHRFVTAGAAYLNAQGAGK